MKLILNVEKSLRDHYFLPNEAALYFPKESAPLRILFEWFNSDDSHVRIVKRMKRFIIRMNLYEQFLSYDKSLTEAAFVNED